MAKNVAVLIRARERHYEGLRSSLGLLLEFHKVSMFVLGHEIEMTEEYRDNMEFLDEMEGFRYSNIAANVEKHGFAHIDLEDLAGRLRDFDLIIPY